MDSVQKHSIVSWLGPIFQWLVLFLSFREGTDLRRRLQKKQVHQGPAKLPGEKLKHFHPQLLEGFVGRKGHPKTLLKSHHFLVGSKSISTLMRSPKWQYCWWFNPNNHHLVSLPDFWTNEQVRNPGDTLDAWGVVTFMVQVDRINPMTVTTLDQILQAPEVSAPLPGTISTNRRHCRNLVTQMVFCC